MMATANATSRSYAPCTPRARAPGLTIAPRSFFTACPASKTIILPANGSCGPVGAALTRKGVPAPTRRARVKRRRFFMIFETVFYL